MNLINLYEKTATERPDAIAIRHSSGELTYGVIADAVRRLTGGLLNKGVGHDSRVALLLPNIPHFVICYLAVLKTGATIIPISTGLPKHELSLALEESEADTLICWSGELALIEQSRSAIPVLSRVIVLGEKVPSQYTSLIKLISQSHPHFEPADLDDDDIALMILGNGRSGRPNFAEYTHQILAANALALRDTLELTQDDCIGSLIPFSDVAGIGLFLNLFIVTGCTIAVTPNGSADNYGSLLNKLNATIFVGYPSHYRGSSISGNDSPTTTSLRLAISTGGHLKDDYLKEFERLHGGYVLECYISREAGPVVAVNKWRTGRRVGSLGHPLPGIEMRVMSGGQRECSIGEVGEIVVRGNCGMRNYTGRSRLGAYKIVDKWIRTEDLGRMDINGFFYLSPSVSERFVRDGKAFYVSELELILSYHPDIEESAVVITHDDGGTQNVRVCAVPRAGSKITSDELMAYLHKQLASNKWPDVIRFYKDLPRTPTGVIDREGLKDTPIEG